MNEKLKGKIIIRHAVCWAAAFVTPPIVMAVLDGFDMHTPTRVAVFSSIVLMGIFPISNALLMTALNSLTVIESGAETDASRTAQ